MQAFQPGYSTQASYASPSAMNVGYAWKPPMPTQILQNGSSLQARSASPSATNAGYAWKPPMPSQMLQSFQRNACTDVQSVSSNRMLSPRRAPPSGSHFQSFTAPFTSNAAMAISSPRAPTGLAQPATQANKVLTSRAAKVLSGGLAEPATQVQYGYWHDRGAVQLRQIHATDQSRLRQHTATDQMRLSPGVMAKVKQYTVNHHWRDLAKQCRPCFTEAGNGAAGLDYEQTKQFYRLVGAKFFGSASFDDLLDLDIFERFDFNGDEVLEFLQAFKSLKNTLYEIFHASGGEAVKKPQFKTPKQMGYTIIKELARGGQGAAILATSQKRGNVVLKTYEKSNPNAGTIEEHITEMEILKEVGKSEHVMHAFEIFQDTKCVYCVNELMSGGDLQQLREKAQTAGIALTEDYFQNMFRQCLLGLDHIHQHGLMHCDLKEPNIMIKNSNLRKPQVAIIDFGLAHACVGSGESGGTPGYIPPETNANYIWYPKGDIFSMGVTFFGLLADETPNENTGKFGVFQEGFGDYPEEDIVTFTATRPLPMRTVEAQYPGAASWLPAMCSKEKRPRPRALQLLNLPWFKSGEGGAVRGGGAMGVKVTPTKATPRKVSPRQWE